MMYKVILFTIFLMLVLCGLSVSQTPVEPAEVKIAVVRFPALGDRSGIPELYHAYELSDRNEMSPRLAEVYRKIDELRKEINRPDSGPETRQAKEKLLLDLNNERLTLLRLQESLRQQREKDILDPVLAKINEALKKVSAGSRLVILDIYKHDTDGVLLVCDRRIDITESFIGYYRSKSRSGDSAFLADLAPGRVAVIDTSAFFDEKKGINEIRDIPEVRENKEKMCSRSDICERIGKSIQLFSQKLGYPVVFDSSKKLPPELAQIQVKDLTWEFIEYFNKTK